jgi:SAM-dependent methyltransferase
MNRLLDVGCGTGVYLEAMAKRGWSVHGVEPDAVAAARAVERLQPPPGRIVVGRIEDSDFPREEFDLVTMAHVLEHLHEPRKVLESIHQLLRPGGLVRLWLPNFESIERRIFGKSWFGLDVPRHLYHFDPQTITALLKVSGFRIERLVPQYQTNTLSGSARLRIDAFLGRQVEFRQSMLLYYAFVPLGALLLGFGVAGALDVTARKPT